MKFKHGTAHRLSRNVFRQLIAFLKAPHKRGKTSNWGYLIDLWDTANEDDPVKEIADLDKMSERGDFLYNSLSGVK